MAIKTLKKKIGQSGISRMTAEKLQLELYNFSKKIRVLEIKIKPSSIPNKDDIDFTFYKNCFHSNESLHHSLLKWFAYKYLQENILNFVKFNYSLESQIYLPTTRYSKDSTFREYGRILGKREIIPTIRNQIFQETDVSCSFGSVIVECGITSTMSLALPLTTGAANTIIWLPYQNKNNRNIEWSNFEKPLRAFHITSE